MFNFFGKKHIKRRQQLAMQRPMTSLLERDILAISDELEYDYQNWVAAYVDRQHKASFDGGVTTAYRAISISDGALFWLVTHVEKKFAYHSEKLDPLDAVRDAERAWIDRKAVRRQWHKVEEQARDLLMGRVKLKVTVDDAMRSPLCGMGIREFMRRNYMQNVSQMSGRFAAILMKIDPQVGFAINQAFLRHRAETS
ncbi:MAG: hypothetical protein AAF066_01465 [Pseudomonadota bacterium]